MKEGLLGGTLSVSPRSELEEARLHVARWFGSESAQGRRVSALRGRGARRRVGLAARRRRAARSGGPRRHARAWGAWGDRIDEWRAVRARHAGGAGLGG